MGLPSENRPVAPSNGTFDNDYPPGASEPQSHAQEDAGDTEVRNAPVQPETPGRLPEANSEQQLAERPRGGSRKPSGAVKEQRMCGKCGTHLTGQFVRALGGTYHLECFTCHVSFHPLIYSRRPSPFLTLLRIVTKSWRPSSSLYRTSHQTSTHYVRLTTSADLTCFVTLAKVHFEDHTSLLWTGSTTSSISPAASVRPSLVHKTHTTSTKAMCIVITTTRQNLRRNATDVRLPS